MSSATSSPPPLLAGIDVEREYRTGPEVVRVLRGASVEIHAGEVVALAEVGLADLLRHRPGELSGGEQQRVAVARALMNGPKVILADEPTGNLDPKTSAVIYDLFLQLQAERGIAFLIATHNPDLARKAERVYRLVEGRAREVDPSER